MHMTVFANIDNFIFKNCIWKCLFQKVKGCFLKIHLGYILSSFFYLPASIAAEKSSPFYGCVIQPYWHQWSWSCCSFSVQLDLPVQLDRCSYSCIALYCSAGTEGVLEISCQGGSTPFGISSDLYWSLWIVIPRLCQFLVNNNEEKHTVGNMFESPCCLQCSCWFTAVGEDSITC